MMSPKEYTYGHSLKREQTCHGHFTLLLRKLGRRRETAVFTTAKRYHPPPTGRDALSSLSSEKIN